MAATGSGCDQPRRADFQQQPFGFEQAEKSAHPLSSEEYTSTPNTPARAAVT
jgi:hypothetical protein